MAVNLYEEHRPREATITVSVAPDFSGDFVCDSVADNVEIQAAIDYQNAVSPTVKGAVVLMGAFTFAVDGRLILPSYMILDLRQATITCSPNTSNSPVYATDQSNIEILGGEIDVDKANQVNLTLRGIYFVRVIDSLIRDTIVGNATLAGLDLRGCTRVTLQNCQALTNGKDAGGTVGAGFYVRDDGAGVYSTDIILEACVGNGNGLGAGLDGTGLQVATGDNYVLVSDFIGKDNTRYGVKLQCSGGSVLENIFVEGNEWGISTPSCENAKIKNVTSINNTINNILSNASKKIIIDGFYCEGAGVHGIRIGSDVEDLILKNGYSIGSNGHGVFVTSATRCEFENIYCINNDILETNVFNGFVFDDGVECILRKIVSYDTRDVAVRQRRGILILGDTANCMIIGCICYQNAWDGIALSDNTSDCILTENISLSNGNYGINIATATCVRNLVKNNLLRLNGSAPFQDLGTDTKLATVPIPLVQGTTFISTAGEAWGWEISADTNFALGVGWLPLEVQQVVRIRVIGVALAAPGAGDYMRIQITGEGGTFDENFAAEPIDVVDHNNEEVNVAIDDAVNWVFDVTDDADIGDLLGGDRLQIKVLHEGAGNGDAATNAIIDTVQVEIV